MKIRTRSGKSYRRSKTRQLRLKRKLMPWRRIWKLQERRKMRLESSLMLFRSRLKLLTKKLILFTMKRESVTTITGKKSITTNCRGWKSITLSGWPETSKRWLTWSKKKQNCKLRDLRELRIYLILTSSKSKPLIVWSTSVIPWRSNLAYWRNLKMLLVNYKSNNTSSRSEKAQIRELLTVKLRSNWAELRGSNSKLNLKQVERRRERNKRRLKLLMMTSTLIFQQSRISLSYLSILLAMSMSLMIQLRK